MAWRHFGYFPMTLTKERLQSLLSYDEETGLFTWKVGRRGANAGDIAGSPDKDGYVGIRVDYKRYKAHRLAFLYMTGSWPKDQVDHVNLVKSDNRWSNLREASVSQNAANRRVRSGKQYLKGAYPQANRWYSHIRKNGKAYYLGSFLTEEEANAAYESAARLLHGEFAHP